MHLAASLGVEDRVHLLGPVPYGELLNYTSCATAGIYLPRLEGISVSYRFSLPNKIFEFVMGRVPSIMTALPEIRRIWTSSIAAWPFRTTARRQLRTLCAE